MSVEGMGEAEEDQELQEFSQEHAVFIDQY